jgi:hypothetical protein
MVGMTAKQPPEKPAKQPFQFHLASLLICVTVAAVVFAVIGRFGVDGLMERLGAAITVGGLFVPFVEFYYWWKREVEDGW